MKFASSIRYGGELVGAAEVDYDAYRHLGLICPHCSGPVFFTAAHERRLGCQGMKASIPAQFRHFKASDPVLVKICQARVAQYNQKEVAVRATIARNQRLKIMQRWFWHILTDRAPAIIPYLDDPDVQSDRYMTQRVLVGVIREKFAQQCDKDAAWVIKTMLEPGGKGWKVTQRRLLEDLQKLTLADIRLHLAILCEIFKFMQSRSSTHMFDQLIVASTGLTYYSVEGKKALSEGVDISDMAYRRLVGLIAVIPWADEFNKYAAVKVCSQRATPV